MGFEIDVEAHGPLFEPGSHQYFDIMMESTRDQVMSEARDLVFQLGSVESFRSHPTMKWEGALHVTDYTYSLAVLSDPVIYRCWLEGDGTRNAASRFKGYWMFRRARNRMVSRSVEIANVAVAKLAAFFNG